MKFVEAYFDRRADSWNETCHQESPIMDAIVAIAGIQQDSRICDLGSGCGIMAEAYKRIGSPEATFVDVSHAMINHAISRYDSIPSFHFIAQDAYSFTDAQGFDAVVIYNAYPHFLDRTGLVQHVASLLKSNGRFVVAHSMSREALNKHHENVPSEICFNLLPAKTEAQYWRPYFYVDTIVDSPGFYCIAGTVKELFSHTET